MFETLSSAFMEEPAMVQKKIKKALVLYLKCVLILRLNTKYFEIIHLQICFNCSGTRLLNTKSMTQMDG